MGGVRFGPAVKGSTQTEDTHGQRLAVKGLIPRRKRLAVAHRRNRDKSNKRLQRAFMTRVHVCAGVFVAGIYHVYVHLCILKEGVCVYEKNDRKGYTCVCVRACVRSPGSMTLGGTILNLCSLDRPEGVELKEKRFRPESASTDSKRSATNAMLL